MAITKMILIDGKEVRLRASAAVPRLYRIKFRRDIFQDMKKLHDSYARVMKECPDGTTEEEYAKERGFDIVDLELFENVAYIMVKHGDPDNIPDDPTTWLDNMDGVFSIIEVLPEILNLWGLNQETTIENKKKLNQITK